MTILVTGGSGFIGHNFIRFWMEITNEAVINLDKLTYAGVGVPSNSNGEDGRSLFIHGDIGNYELLDDIYAKYSPRAIINFAAESHVDRSIQGPKVFFETNVMGTLCLLESSRNFWAGLSKDKQEEFRFLHISTDEVFGSLGPNDASFDESHPYRPNSPYSASKASSDHLVRAFNQTHGLPVITTNCSNNFGPFQFPEKLIPLVVCNALERKSLPIYGDGKQVRDWLFVQDHCRALELVLRQGAIGETYNIGGGNEFSNIDIVQKICAILELERPLTPNDEIEKYADLIEYVADRLGHDTRYAVNSDKIQKQLNWKPLEQFDLALAKTVKWYVNNQDWCALALDKIEEKKP